MDGQQYLNQISQPTILKQASKKPGFLSSPIFKVIVAGIAALILVFIIGGISNGNRNSFESTAIALELHLTNLSETIATYQPSLKSSSLRSYSASLSSNITDLDDKLSTFLEETYGYNASSAPENIVASETALSEELNNDLFTAKINGRLDTTYAHKMAYEIAIITARESSLIQTTDNEELKAELEKSYNSLSNLYDSFKNPDGTN